MWRLRDREVLEGSWLFNNSGCFRGSKLFQICTRQILHQCKRFQNNWYQLHLTFQFNKKLDNFPFIFCSHTKIVQLFGKVSFENCQWNWPTPDQLADYLTYLDGNDTAYAEYFEWKLYFKSKSNLGRVFCQICQALNNDSYPVSTHKVPVEPIKFYCDCSREHISFSK